MGPNWMKALRDVASDTPASLTLITKADVVAIKGQTPSGAVGALADGAWHPVRCDGLSADPYPSPPPEFLVAPADEDAARPWPLLVAFTNGTVVGCDFLVSATGVVPETSCLGAAFKRDDEGAVIVNDRMQTTGDVDVYAAGDAAGIHWPESKQWFQMRLWRQARTSGMYAAMCMTDNVDELGAGMLFEVRR